MLIVERAFIFRCRHFWQPLLRPTRRTMLAIGFSSQGTDDREVSRMVVSRKIYRIVDIYAVG
jgi:hypothetical protein